MTPLKGGDEVANGRPGAQRQHGGTWGEGSCRAARCVDTGSAARTGGGRHRGMLRHAYSAACAAPMPHRTLTSVGGGVGVRGPHAARPGSSQRLSAGLGAAERLAMNRVEAGGAWQLHGRARGMRRHRRGGRRAEGASGHVREKGRRRRRRLRWLGRGSGGGGRLG